VDDDRIAVVGHSEGAAVAMLVADKENKIDAIVLVAGVGTTGYDLVLEQQRAQLEASAMTPEERDAKIALQKKVMDATVSANWEGVPPELRRAADSAWFRSFLTFDPAKAMKKVDQPILIVSAERDAQVPAHHAEKLAALANARRDKPATPLVTLHGVNHLLVPAPTGAISEYGSLGAAKVTPDLAREIAAFLNAAYGR
jgi:pimeloyl-ACP methyl ester carboxylesterase